MLLVVESDQQLVRLPIPTARADLTPCLRYGIATCSTISSPKPSSAGMCMGVFDSRRMRRMPRSDRICPPSPIARRIRPLRACDPSRARSSWCSTSRPACDSQLVRRHRRAARPKGRASACGQSQIPAKYCADKASPRNLLPQSCASTGPASRGSGNRRQTHRPPCSGYAPAPAPRVRRASAAEPGGQISIHHQRRPPQARR